MLGGEVVPNRRSMSVAELRLVVVVVAMKAI
jgi:hypothetical protein